MPAEGKRFQQGRSPEWSRGRELDIGPASAILTEHFIRVRGEWSSGYPARVPDQVGNIRATLRFETMERISAVGFWLYLIVALFLIATAISPHDYFTWALENTWVVAGLILVAVLSFRAMTWTPLLSWALFLHALILIYGGWYTYEHVPLGEWMRNVFDFERNHYDRVGHFAQGFFPALLYREVYLRNIAGLERRWLEFFVFVTCMAFTGIFELIEFAAAILFGGASDSYLGSQGDIWDAQWDMAYCGFGAAISIVALGGWHRIQIRGSREYEEST